MATLRCCVASSCRAAGADALQSALADARARVPGAATALRIKPVGCLRLCARGPLVALDGPGADTRLYGAVPPEQATELVQLAAAAGGDAPAHGDPLADHAIDLAQPFFVLQQSVVLEGCGQVDPESLDDALAHGAYSQLQRCRAEARPAEVRACIRRSGLRGRGGAGYPTGLKWDTVALQPPGPRVVVCNADEGDPGAFMDRAVLEGDPHRLLEGLAIAAYGVGADRGFLYVRAEYPLAIARLRLALQQVRAAGLLGHLDLQVRVGAGAYVCGEETALIASIEGGRGTPRSRPPYPAERGLWGAPTLINNVETLAAVPAILRRGAAWYASLGTDGSKGTKVFALSGHLPHTGLVEVPMGTSLRTVVETMGGATSIKAVQTGGPAGGCIPAALLDTPIDYDSLSALGSRMGSGGLVVLGEGVAMPALARQFMRFCAVESCGKCVPCRAGTVQLEQLLERFCQGRASQADLQQLEQLAVMVQATSLCGLGQGAPNPVLSTLRWFRHEYEAAIP
ncbi:MAG: NADH-ubiquinone oxidoreductase-F iron-sulfur binding region domain-containing protein [Cyanobacteriota bacterium]|nr:NADH-ubiquinone oxidoreductase-F iron-sulfur binding region domain-containing protein [Cyanobacteriota bacterium]